MVLVAPSLLSADMSALGEEVEKLEKSGADLLHFDVMDGHFVPNMTFGPMFLRALKKCTKLPFDVHLMVNEAERFVPWFIEAKADIITFHLETASDPDFLICQIKKAGIKAGVSIKPDTDINILKNLTEIPDLVLVMSVEPGFGGQQFRSNTPDRIAYVRQLFSNKNVLIEVDGGINIQTASSCIQAGVDILVAGTAVFRDGLYAENIRTIRGEKQ